MKAIKVWFKLIVIISCNEHLKYRQIKYGTIILDCAYVEFTQLHWPEEVIPILMINDNQALLT